MLSQTREALKNYNNQHEFELMCADILNFWRYRHVRPIAPRGGADGGRDIEFLTDDSKKGLAWVTLRPDIETKFKEDATKRQPGDYDLYILFCTHLTDAQKSKFAEYCREKLKAEFLDCDIEALRSILGLIRK